MFIHDSFGADFSLFWNEVSTGTISVLSLSGEDWTGGLQKRVGLASFTWWAGGWTWKLLYV